MTELTADLILDLAEIRENALALVGGKGLNLGRLTRAGLPVPPGFVVTTEAYRLRESASDTVREAVFAAHDRLGGGPKDYYENGALKIYDGPH